MTGSEEESNGLDSFDKHDDFERIKIRFEGEINSVRRFEKITNLEELLDALEDRDALTGSDILKGIRPEEIRRKSGPEESNLPPKVFKLLKENYGGDWKVLGVHLKLTPSQLRECNDVATVLKRFENNCRGISGREIAFRLNRALDKCKEKRLKLEVLKLMTES